MGRHRLRCRRRAHRALPLLRIQAALPLRDHGPGDRGVPVALRAVERRRRRSAPGARVGHGGLLRALRARRPAQPRPGRGAGLLSRRSNSPREEEVSGAGRTRSPVPWASFLSHAMAQGDPRATRGFTRAILDHNSVWHWYARTSGWAWQRQAFFTTSSFDLAPPATGAQGGGARERWAALDGPDPHSRRSAVATTVRSGGPTAATGASRQLSAARGPARVHRRRRHADWPTTCLSAAPPATSVRPRRDPLRQRRADRDLPRGGVDADGPDGALRWRARRRSPSNRFMDHRGN